MNLKSTHLLKDPFFILSIILVISAYLKIAPILNYNFPFTMDQARDMLDIREIVVFLHPSLIGPTTSINGVYLGPFYYYFNVLPFLISGGDPAALVYWNILWYLLGAVVIYFLNSKDKAFGFVFAVLFLMSPAFFYSSRYFWSANPMPYVTAFYFLILILHILKKDIKSSILAGLISGLAMQFEAAFGILFFPFLLLYSLIRKVPLKNILISFLGFFATLLPQIFFELRHDFIMSKTFLNELSGKSQILGEKLSFVDTQINHLQSFAQFTGGILEVSNGISLALIVLSILYLLFNFKKLSSVTREYFLSSLLFIIFAILFYSWYLHPLKGWYLLGLRIPYIFILALFLSEIFKLKHFLFKLIIAGLIGYSFINTFIVQSKFIPKDSNSRSGDKSTLRNEIEAIDWVYQKAGGQGFKAYNYIPSVYDYPYQYLYWWHGTKQYGYQPETVTYLDDVPEYIKDNDKFFTKKKPLAGDSAIFLIYEKDAENNERLAAWLGNFTKYCTLEKQAFNWETTVELRNNCP